jgi:choloylglycine hydrolase
MCTSFLLKGSDSGAAYGRSMEFGMPLNSQLMVSPRGYQYQGIGVDGKVGTGLNWTSKYAVAGMNILGLPTYADGMNEKGLVGGLLNAPFTAQYQDVSQADSANSINSSQILLYALTNFATVDEVKAGFEKILVNCSTVAAYKNQTPPVRVPLHDAQGNSIVIEYIKGKLVITDNPTHVCTNDPVLSEQFINIGNYANLSNIEQEPLVINGATYQSPSSGNGMHGLPGDYLSPSRFIRALFLSKSVPASYSTEKMVNAAWHITGSFDIPPGAITLTADNPYGGGVDGIEITEWIIVADSKNMIYNVKMFETTNVYAFDLKKMNFDAQDLTYLKLDKPQMPIQLN